MSAPWGEREIITHRCIIEFLPGPMSLPPLDIPLDNCTIIQVQRRLFWTL